MRPKIKKYLLWKLSPCDDVYYTQMEKKADGFYEK